MTRLGLGLGMGYLILGIREYFKYKFIDKQQFKSNLIQNHAMGNQNQKPNQNGQLIISINHPKFQNAKLTVQGKEKVLQLTMGVDQREYEKWSQAFTKANLNSSFLLLPRKKEFSRKGFCGDSGTLKLKFDNHSYLLTEEIYNRNGKKSKFEEWELWYLLLGLISAHQEVKTKTGERLGDVRPHNIFLNAQAEMKIANVYSWPRESTNFNKTFDNEKTYLAPEDMVRLQMGTNEDSSSYSSEMFSIGFTILSAAMLEDFLRLYNIKNYKFDTTEATNLFNEWKSNTVYSEIFTAVISNLCEFQPQKRLEDEQLWQWISKYEKPIKNKEDFVIEEAPLKIQQEIEEIRRQFPGEEPQVFQPNQEFGQFVQHPFTDKSVVESYIPPNQHYLPRPFTMAPQYQPSQEILQKMPSPRIPIPAQRFYIDQGQQPRLETTASTRLQGSPFHRPTESVQIREQEMISGYSPQEYQQIPEIARRTGGFDSQFAPQVVGRPLQEHELPPEVRRALANEGQLPPQYVSRPLGQGQLPPQMAPRVGSGQTQLPPQFVGRTVNETYLSPRTLPQGYLPQQGMQIDRRSAGNSSIGQQQGLSFFQNVIDPQGVKGGRFEETVYIQRPEFNQYGEYDPQ